MQESEGLGLITPDFDNLIVVAKYLSPIKDLELLRKAIISTLKVDDQWWYCLSGHKRYLDFTLLLNRKFKEELKGVKEKEKTLRSLQVAKPSLACQFNVLISKTTERGSILEVKCLPVLYRLMTQIDRYLERNPVSIFDVKSCIFESTELVRKIFVGSLECEELDPPHPVKPIEEKSYEILFNTKDDKNLTEKILSELKKAKKEVCIVGWIGMYVIPTLKKLKKKGVKIRIITKTPSKTTIGYRDKDEALNELKTFLKKDDLRFLRTGHLRLVIIDDGSIFDGSMDLDSQSLAEREESAMWANNPYMVAKGKIKFDELFKKGKPPKGWK